MRIAFGARSVLDLSHYNKKHRRPLNDVGAPYALGRPNNHSASEPNRCERVTRNRTTNVPLGAGGQRWLQAHNTNVMNGMDDFACKRINAHFERDALVLRSCCR